MDILPTSNSSTAATNNTQDTSTTNETDSSASEPSAQSEQFDTFLELLTAQIRNQDPLAPLDSTQFVEQLATFSNLELQAAGNQTLESIESLLDSMLNETGRPPAADASAA